MGLELTSCRLRRPDTGILYQVVQRNLETFLVLQLKDGKGVPDYVEKEFRNFLECGIIHHGFLRLKCEKCAREKILPLSCNGRTICPTCAGKRMNETSVHITDNLMPRLPSRQWVVTVPIPLRYWMRSKPSLQSKILTIIMRLLVQYYRTELKSVCDDKNLQTGAITVIQQAGSGLNLNLHFHILMVDGAYSMQSEKPVFHKAPAPDDEDIQHTVKNIADRVVRYLRKKGYLEEGSYEDSLRYEYPEWADILAASARNVVAIGNRKNQPVKKLIAAGFGYEDDNPEKQGSLCAAVNGFSLHAATAIGANQKRKLENICRYILRPPVASERFSFLPNGDVLYKLKKPWDNGRTTHLAFSQLDLLARLASLIPAPRVHQVRFHGFLAPNAKLRPLVATSRKKLKEMETKGHESKLTKEGKLKWAQLLERIFRVDIQKCSHCGGRLKIISTILDPNEIKKYLLHTGVDSDPPEPYPARYDQMLCDF